MKTIIVFLALALSACATCREHPVACTFVGAIALGSIAATIEQNQPDHRTTHPTATIGTPNCANGACQ